ncbi:MAG: hypothetical protein ACOYVG_10340 [Bacteroidota bacterium]
MPTRLELATQPVIVLQPHHLPVIQKNGKPVNTSGEGFKNYTVPDVLQQITDAAIAYTYNKQQFSG